MRIAVVTPYYREADDVLRACLDSVRDQTHGDRRHILVADGFPSSLVDAYDVSHIRLPAAHGDNGNLGRCVGAFAAMAEGFDGIAFLDADNWYRADHIARMAALHALTGAGVCTSGRSIHRLDGTLLDANDDESDGETFADTSCLCIFRPAFDVLALWGTMPRETGPICDRLMWTAIQARGLSRAHDPAPTVAFRTQYAAHYEHAGEAPPANAKVSDAPDALRWYNTLPLAHRRGMLLGLGGIDDLTALCNADGVAERPTRFVTLNGNGRAVTLEVPEDSGIRFVLNEIFTEQQYRPVPGLPPPRAVLDIGANVGIASAYFRLMYPDAELVCVEPDPRAYALLEENADALGQCLTFRAALHNGTQVCAFNMAEESTVQSSSAMLSGRVGRQLLLDAESFVASLDRSGFDLIKIDTEGFEIPIVLSLRRRLMSTPIILLEFHSHADRRLLDEILHPTHFLWHAFVNSPHRGTLCYVHQTVGGPILPYQPLT